MQTRAVGERRVDERLRQVDAPARRMEHPLHEVAHGGIGERQREALGDPVSRDEDLVRCVDPELLHGRVVEMLLQRAVSGDRREHLAHGRLLVVDRCQSACQGEVVVPTHLRLRDPAHGVGHPRGIGLVGSQPVPDSLGDDAHDGGHPAILTQPAKQPRNLSTGAASG